jgi:hypothetical protein
VVPARRVRSESENSAHVPRPPANANTAECGVWCAAAACYWCAIGEADQRFSWTLNSNRLNVLEQAATRGEGVLARGEGRGRDFWVWVSKHKEARDALCAGSLELKVALLSSAMWMWNVCTTRRAVVLPPHSPYSLGVGANDSIRNYKRRISCWLFALLVHCVVCPKSWAGYLG